MSRLIALLVILIPLLGFFFGIYSVQDIPQPPSFTRWWYSGHVFFEPHNPYPHGFSQVRIGASLSDLKVVYPHAEADVGANLVHYTIEPERGPFLSVIWLVAKSPPQTVTGVFFTFDDALRGLIQEQMIEAFGLDAIRRESEGAFISALVGSVSIELKEGIYFIR